MRVAALLFAVVFAVYVATPVSIQTDSIWSIPIAASLWLRGDVDLDELRPAIEASGRFGVFEAKGHLHGYFPLGPSVLAVPFVALIDGALRLVPDRAPHWQRAFHGTGFVDPGVFASTERVVASTLTSLAIVFIFLTARRRVGLAAALLVALATAFGTSAYSTASRVLWQHGPSLLAASVVVWLLASPRASQGWAFGVGAVSALAYTLRPVHSVTVLCVGLFFLLTRRRQLLGFVAGALAIAGPFCAMSLGLYGELLPPYYVPQRLAPGTGRFWEALAGNLISPARGRWVHSPFLIAGAVAAARGLRHRTLSASEALFVAVPILHWVTISSFPHWWGGHCVGPRFFTDVLSYLAYFLAGPCEALVTSFAARPARSAALTLALTASVWIHTRSSVQARVHAWNEGPPDVDAAPARLWDWHDLQVLH